MTVYEKVMAAAVLGGFFIVCLYVCVFCTLDFGVVH